MCANSKLFKQRRQRHRKAIEGECSICHEDLDAALEDITFCKSTCGQNIHQQCLDEWESSQVGDATCPMCRRVWTFETKDPEELDAELDWRALQLYVDWLYTRRLNRTDTDLECVDYSHRDLLEAWTVAAVLQDDEFKHAIIAEIVSEGDHLDNTGFGIRSVEYAFGEDIDILGMQNFITEAFLIGIDEDWFEVWSDEYLVNFVHALGRAALCAMGNRPELGSLLEKYTKGEYMIEKEAEESQEN